MHVVYAWIVRGERGIERGLYVVYAGSKLNRVHHVHSRVHHVHLRDFCFLPMLLYIVEFCRPIIRRTDCCTNFKAKVG